MPTTEELEKYLPSNYHNHKIDPYSVIEFRKYLFNYVKGIPGNKEFKTAVAGIKEYAVLCQLMKEFFENTKKLDVVE